MNFPRIALIVSGVLLAACNRSAPAGVAATVNGRSITFSELDMQYQAEYGPLTDRPNDDQLTIQKLEVLRTLIDNEIMLQKAEKLGLMAVDADVESKYNEMKAPYTAEEFQRQMDARKLTIPDLKAQLRGAIDDFKKQDRGRA